MYKIDFGNFKSNKKIMEVTIIDLTQIDLTQKLFLYQNMGQY